MLVVVFNAPVFVLLQATLHAISVIRGCATH